MEIVNQQSILAKIFHDVYREYYNNYRKTHRINIQSLVYLLENMGINVAVTCNLHDKDHDYSFKLVNNEDELIYKQYVYSLSLGADSQAISRFHYTTLHDESLNLYLSEIAKEKILILRDLVKNNIDLVVLATLYYKSTVLRETTDNIGRDYIAALGRISIRNLY